MHVFTAGDDINATKNNTNFRKARDGRLEIQANEAIDSTSVPKPVYVASNGWVGLCDGNDQTKLEFAGFAVYGQNIAEGEFIEVVMGDGMIINDFTGLTRGSKYYVADDGTLSTTIGTYEVLVGIAISATEILIVKGSMEYMGSGSVGANGNATTSINDTDTIPTGAKLAVCNLVSSEDKAFRTNLTVARVGITTSTARTSTGLGSVWSQLSAVWSGSTLTVTLSSYNAYNLTLSGSIYYYR